MGRKMESDIEMGDTEIRRRMDTEGSRIVQHPVCSVSRGNGGLIRRAHTDKILIFDLPAIAAQPLAQR